MKVFEKRIQLIQQFPNSIGAEIGVCKGYFSLEILEQAKVKKLYCIDSWKGPVPGELDFTDEVHEKNYDETLSVLRGHLMGDRVQIIRKKSWEASQGFPFGYLDWAYIDAAHDFQNVLDDLMNWAVRIRPGGVIMGHDYTRAKDFGVIPAVERFCEDASWKLTAVTSEEYPSYQLERI